MGVVCEMGWDGMGLGGWSLQCGVWVYVAVIFFFFVSMDAAFKVIRLRCLVAKRR